MSASRRRDLLRVLVAGVLGVGVAVVVSACSGSSAKLIPVASSEPLQNDFEAVAAAAQSGSGSCANTEAALLKTDQDFDALPTSVDAGLRSRLREGIAKLHEDALAECAKQASTPSTSTTKTATTKSTPTTQTSTTTSTETQTTTGETNTATTPPTTTPGGGTQVPENEGAGPGGGTGVGEEANKPGGAEGGGASGNGAAGNGNAGSAPGASAPGANGNAPGGVIGQLLRRFEERRRRFDRTHGIHRGRR